VPSSRSAADGFCRCSAQPIRTEPYGPGSTRMARCAFTLPEQGESGSDEPSPTDLDRPHPAENRKPKGEGRAAEQHLTVATFHVRTATRAPGDNECAVDPAFVAHDRAGGGGPVGARSTGRRHRRCWPASTACRTTRLASHKQIAADLLPEAGDSRAVEGGEGR
jgi:hypothetical protein